MIICSNCGTINSEGGGNICRKCGALLPVSSSSKHRTNRRPQQSKPKAEKTQSQKPLVLNEIPTQNFFNNKPRSVEKKVEAWSNEESVKEPLDKPEILSEDEEPSEVTFKPGSTQAQSGEMLREITPQPFKGSLISSRGMYGTATKPQPTRIKQEGSEPQEKPPHTGSSLVSSVPSNESHLLKRKQLEDDMTNVLSFLSKKITIEEPQAKAYKLIPKDSEKSVENIPPSSINDILRQLTRLDRYIEASAIIKGDGTILASAISNRVSDSLFATIGQNLSMISKDIIQGLSAGTLSSISIRATRGVLDLAPIDKKNPLLKDMLLIIYSHAKVKSGIISFAVGLIKRQLKEYMGMQKA